MKRATQITTAEHSLLCNQSYLDLLRNNVTQSDYILCINSHTQLALDRLYNYYVSGKIVIDEYNESKSITTKIHNAYLRKGNVYA